MTILNKIYRFVGSFGFSCILLLFLLVLTYLGTIAQAEESLYDVQKRYFDSVFLTHYLFGKVPIFLPGATLLMALLFVNLTIGGVIRLRKSWSKAGLLITHLGILYMLLAGLVKFVACDEGHMTLYEGQRSDRFKSYYEWEIAIRKSDVGEGVDEWVIPGDAFKGLDEDEERLCTSDDLPFEITISNYMRNSSPMPKGPMFEVDVPVVDGAFLKELPLAMEAEQNVAGCYVTVRDKKTGSATEGILWGFERYPLTVKSGGEDWMVDLRHESWQLPFTIVLDKFTRELHPRTGMAKVFLSDVTMIEGDAEQTLKITMNEPLRDSGFTLFQASWGPSNARPGDPLFSTFAVVRNPSDQWPLYSCIIISIGLLFHFVLKLSRYVRSQARKAS